MDVEREIQLLKDRNKRVDSDKGWETSKTRKFLISLFTYVSIAMYLQIIDVPDPWLNAIVPAIGLLLSTLTLPIFKDLWIKYIYKR